MNWFWFQILLVTVVFGGLGGFAGGFAPGQAESRPAPGEAEKRPRHWRNILVGITAAFGVLFFAEALFGVKVGELCNLLAGAATGTTTEGSAGAGPSAGCLTGWGRFVGLVVLAGFAGLPMLNMMTRRLGADIRQMEQKVEDIEQRNRASEETQKGQARLVPLKELQKQFEETKDQKLEQELIQEARRAERHFEAALKLKPDFQPALLGLVRALGYQRQFEQALSKATTMIEKFPTIAELYFLRARYRLLKDETVPPEEMKAALDDLERAVGMSPGFRFDAAVDRVFKKHLAGDPRYEAFIA